MIQKEKRSIALLFSWIIGIIYIIFLVVYIISKCNLRENIELTVEAFLAIPHLILVLAAVIFSAVGWASKSSWASLTGAAMYAAAIAFFPLGVFFIAGAMATSLIGISRLSR